MLGIGGKWDRGGIGVDKGAVECEIEVLYDILAWGVLEKMKMYPGPAMPAKVQKAGFNILPYLVKCCPAWAVHVARRLFAWPSPSVVAVGLPCI